MLASGIKKENNGIMNIFDLTDFLPKDGLQNKSGSCQVSFEYPLQGDWKAIANKDNGR
jgi:hypothetical protein